eukprot:TRINITY_DN13819_c0_g1_i1.p1 TRINITY_DN13819_c0_g1~~TRINITY_DN13819_c0_g1_i1.p1  ORF type:complete len:665 (+),score=106.39 TRINITY_DN13819_c0_g1_i1:201-1997(+)
MLTKDSEMGSLGHNSGYAKEAHMLRTTQREDFGKPHTIAKSIGFAQSPSRSYIGGGTTWSGGAASGLRGYQGPAYNPYSKGVQLALSPEDISKELYAAATPRAETWGARDHNDESAPEEVELRYRPLHQVWAAPPPADVARPEMDGLTMNEVAGVEPLAAQPDEMAELRERGMDPHQHVFDKWTRWPNPGGVPFPIVNINGETLRTVVLDPFLFDVNPRGDIIQDCCAQQHMMRFDPNFSRRTASAMRRWVLQYSRKPVHPQSRTGKSRARHWTCTNVRKGIQRQSRMGPESDQRPMKATPVQTVYGISPHLALLGFRMTLTLKRLQGRLTIIDDFQTRTSSPYEVVEMFRRLGSFEPEHFPDGALLVNGGNASDEYYSFEDVPVLTETAWKRAADLHMYMVPPSHWTTLDMMMRSHLVITEGALNQLTRKAQSNKIAMAPAHLQDEFPMLSAERGEREHVPEEVFDEDQHVHYADILAMSDTELREAWASMKSRRRIFHHERSILELERRVAKSEAQQRMALAGKGKFLFSRPAQLNPDPNALIDGPMFPREHPHLVSPVQPPQDWNLQARHIKMGHLGHIGNTHWGFYSGEYAAPV